MGVEGALIIFPSQCLLQIIRLNLGWLCIGLTSGFERGSKLPGLTICSLLDRVLYGMYWTIYACSGLGCGKTSI